MKLPKLDNISPKAKGILWVASLALVGVMLYFLSLPFVRGVKKLKAESKVKTGELEDSRKYVNAKDSVLQEFQEVESMLGESQSDAESISDIKEDIEEMARRAGLTIDPPSHSEPETKEDEPWREYIVQLAKCEGSMDAILALVDMLESAPVVYRVETMNLTPAKSGKGVSASIVISRIMLPPQEEPEDVAATEEG